MKILTSEQDLDLLQRLIKVTQAKKLVWAAVDGDQYSFRAVASGRYGYAIVSNDRDDLPPFTVSILDFEATTPAILHSIETASYASFNDDLGELYILVKQGVLGIEGMASDIFGELDDLDDLDELDTGASPDPF